MMDGGKRKENFFTITINEVLDVFLQNEKNADIIGNTRNLCLRIFKFLP